MFGHYVDKTGFFKHIIQLGLPAQLHYGKCLLNGTFCRLVIFIPTGPMEYRASLVSLKSSANSFTYSYFSTESINILSPVEDRFEISSGADMRKISVMEDKMNVTSPKMLAQVVRNARKQRKLTQREAAESMCMKQSTVSVFENHPEGTRLDTLVKVLAVLDLKLQVVSRKGENKSSDGGPGVVIFGKISGCAK